MTAAAPPDPSLPHAKPLHTPTSLHKQTEPCTRSLSLSRFFGTKPLTVRPGAHEKKKSLSSHAASHSSRPGARFFSETRSSFGPDAHSSRSRTPAIWIPVLTPPSTHTPAFPHLGSLSSPSDPQLASHRHPSRSAAPNRLPSSPLFRYFFANRQFLLSGPAQVAAQPPSSLAIRSGPAAAVQPGSTGVQPGPVRPPHRPSQQRPIRPNEQSTSGPFGPLGPILPQQPNFRRNF
ncbi:hypothetical protein CRG98_046499 [Punica granatum]|uniref:Uncharacterized protein n=1 Tax=Punica granatum TaxID=22663 RepID=A0A2I0HN23_PUNGR|nr:hypothetical protein CRG98_046499 [Punica granatum]